MSDLQLVPVTFEEACDFIDRYHEHHGPPQGWKFGVGCATVVDPYLVGVATVGRPVSRHQDDGRTLEVTRLCTDGETRNVASKLYAACWRAAKNMGYTRLITYTLVEEEGTSLNATVFEVVHERTGGGSWDRDGRPRRDEHPTGQKTLWAVEA